MRGDKIDRQVRMNERDLSIMSCRGYSLRKERGMKERNGDLFYFSFLCSTAVVRSRSRIGIKIIILKVSRIGLAFKNIAQSADARRRQGGWDKIREQ